jgi:hypothetical protein
LSIVAGSLRNAIKPRGNGARISGSRRTVGRSSHAERPPIPADEFRGRWALTTPRMFPICPNAVSVFAGQHRFLTSCISLTRTSRGGERVTQTSVVPISVRKGLPRTLIRGCSANFRGRTMAMLSGAPLGADLRLAWGASLGSANRKGRGYAKAIERPYPPRLCASAVNLPVGARRPLGMGSFAQFRCVGASGARPIEPTPRSPGPDTTRRPASAARPYNCRVVRSFPAGHGVLRSDSRPHPSRGTPLVVEYSKCRASPGWISG